MPKDKYCVLPNSSRSEFLALDAELKNRGVSAKYSDLKSGGRIYWIPANEIHKLPKRNDVPYLGSEKWGYGISTYEFINIEEMLKSGRGSVWKDVI